MLVYEITIACLILAVVAARGPPGKSRTLKLPPAPIPHAANRNYPKNQKISRLAFTPPICHANAAALITEKYCGFCRTSVYNISHRYFSEAFAKANAGLIPVFPASR